ncbi:RNA 2',3'-cyclic phosphodiesterase [Streptosporangium sp. NPDC050855]|uniref:RNA 2',3'-cyclic phosphodiesterase n=1 Tax=Streptosporangium sp. NPDC050855 TaxID=3366194 RepID=UPI0037B0D867
MRLFVGLTPPPRARDELARALASSRARWPALRWLDPANWHVTLAFLGEVPDRALPGLRSRLGDAAAGHGPMTLSFAGAGAFPSPDGARVLWTGVTGDVPRLARLAGSVRDGVRAALEDAAGSATGRAGGAERRFVPHLSLARCRPGTDVRGLVEEFAPFSGTSWEASAVHLMRSDAGTAAPRGGRVRYESVAEWRLAARAPRGQG